MKKLFLLFCLMGSVVVINAQENSSEESSQTNDAITYGVKYNSTTKKNEIYRANDDGTETFLIDFKFPSGGWTPGNSFADSKTGKLYLWDSGSNICVSGDCDGPGVRVYGPLSDELKGFVVYDPATNTIEIGVKKGYKDGYQKTFQSVLKIDDLIQNSTDTDGDAISVIGSNEVVGANGNTLISEEENGEIHIGENSLVTVEKDGVQLLYATDANDEQIDINIKAGTDLLVDGKSVTQALTDIDTNKTNIATNTTNIATNATGIATNKTNIATNTTNIATNTTGIANNVVRLDNLAALAASNTSRVEGLETLTGLMQNEYRSGIASSIALSQIQYAASGFSIGVGHGEFKNKDEMAVGIGYGGQFNEDVGFQFQFGTSGDSTGFGFTVNF